MNNVHYSPEALQDLNEIWNYILSELCNQDAAENVVNKIMDTIDKLATFPEMGALLSNVANIESDYRFVISGSYMAFYRLLGIDVYVDRVLYGRRDYLRVLFDNLSNENE